MNRESLNYLIACELKARAEQVNAAARLLDEGNTVPFITRYCKEVAGGLDNKERRTLETRQGYFRELDERRQSILKSIDEQGKLTEALTSAIQATLSKTELEDIYLSYKPKRRTRGQIAIEAVLSPLADRLWQDSSTDPDIAASCFVNPAAGVTEAKAALDGARYILIKGFAEDSGLLVKIRDYLWKNAIWCRGLCPVKRKKAPNSATTSVITNRCLRSPLTVRWPCCADAPRVFFCWR